MLFILMLQSYSSYACDVLQPDSAIKKEVYPSTFCLTFKNVVPSNANISIDRSFAKNAAFHVKVETVTGDILVNQEFSSASGVDVLNKKLNTNYNTELKVSIETLTNYRIYKFSVIHYLDDVSNTSTIYIGLNSEIYGSNTPPCFGCGGGSQQNFTNMSTAYAVSTTSAITNTTMSEALECTDSNRPPEPPPTSRDDPSTALSINGVLSESQKFIQSANENLTSDGVEAAMLSRAIAMHDYGGALDVGHNPNSDFVGSTSMGNFLYGANMAAMRFTDSAILRASAAIQGLAGRDGSIITAMKNYLTGNGDNIGDQEEVMRGIRYYREVYSKQTNFATSVSCVDSQSIENESQVEDLVELVHSSSVGGGAEGDGDPGDTSGSGSGGGSSGGGSGTGWCFVDDKGTIQYCWME
ncbi:polymorphic toxin type 44 domain-containing protein [Alteromonas mediterranea]|uniref:polymorphic toxin type 44 domain-containing protein n=1 Tax=Alteromonas mediterranea TaxID=314275 RepID=UPI002FE212F8